MQAGVVMRTYSYNTSVLHISDHMDALLAVRPLMFVNIIVNVLERF